MRPLLLLLTGVVACSTSVLWIKLSRVDPVLLVGLRLSIAVAFLGPFAYRDWRRHRASLNWSHLRDAAIPGVVFALHLITWNIGLRMTLATNGTLIVNLTPIATPFFLLALLGERITRREVLATLLGLTGLVVLFASDFHVSSENFRGDLICLVSMSLMALYLTLGRKFRHHPTNLLYVVPLYTTAAVVAFAATPLWPSSDQPAEPLSFWAEAPWVLLLALLPTLVGHSLLAAALRDLRGQVVAIVNTTQFAFAGLLAWAFLGEHPEPAFYLAAALAIVSSLLVARAGYSSRRRASADEQAGA